MKNEDKKSKTESPKRNEIEIEIDGEELTEEQLKQVQGGAGVSVDIVSFAAAYGEPRAAM